MLNRVFAAMAILSVAACGGSSGSSNDGPTVTPVPTVDPVSSAGFATASSVVGGGTSFDVQNAFRLLGDANGNIVIDQQDVEYQISNDGSTVTVVVGGETFVLNQTASGYGLVDGSSFVTATRVFSPGPEAEIVDVFAVTNNVLNDSSFIIGFDTDPSEIAALSGTAQMNGAIFVTARNGFDLTNGEGEVTLDVDFNNDTISGDFTLGEADGSGFSIPATTFALESTDIVANSFTGDISLTSGDIDGTIERATYAGRFYGDGASAAGGQIIAQINGNGDDTPTFIEGAFLAVD